MSAVRGGEASRRMRTPICSGLVIGLFALACGRSDPMGPNAVGGSDAGVVARESVEGCTSVSAYDRVRLRSATRAPAGCVMVVFVNNYKASAAELRLPTGWTLEGATWRATRCDAAGWRGQAEVIASEVTGRLVLLPTASSSSTSSDFELLVRFDKGTAPAQVELGGVGTLLRSGCP